jgi:hypothetical protein
MVRGWIGAAILAVFLALGFATASAMENAHYPTQQLLEQAAEATLSGDFEQGVKLGAEAKQQWQHHRNGTATVADHSPMDDVDALFAEMEIYASTEEKPHFAACCLELSRRLKAIAEAHTFRWWNVL